MSTVVTIMDRNGFDANTDIIVVVDPSRQQLLWIPRDLWCKRQGNRINAAFKSGGHGLLLESLAEHNITAGASLCITRQATEYALQNVSLLVPVPVKMRFSYPLTPTARIEDGQKEIEFNPPAEMLRGERVHQWIGARGASDLHRIERQKVFVRRLLDTRFDFNGVLQNTDWFSSHEQTCALEDVKAVSSDWQFSILGPLRTEVINGMQVLVPDFHP